MDVVATSLFATGEMSDVEMPAELNVSKLVMEVRFHRKLTEGTSEVPGAYHLPDAEWRLFKFRREPIDQPCFRLAVPVPNETTRVAELEFSVPLQHELSEAYMFRAIAEVHGIVRSHR